MLPVICAAIFYACWKCCVSSKRSNEIPQNPSTDDSNTDKDWLQSIYENRAEENPLIYDGYINNSWEKKKKEIELPTYDFSQPKYDPVQVMKILDFHKKDSALILSGFSLSNNDNETPTPPAYIENFKKRKDETTNYPIPKVGKRR